MHGLVFLLVVSSLRSCWRFQHHAICVFSIVHIVMSYFSASQNKDAPSVDYILPPATLEDDSNAQNDASFDNLDNEDTDDISNM